MTDWKDKLKQVKDGFKEKFELDFKSFKEEVMPLLEGVVEEYRTPVDMLYPQVWGTQPNSLTFGISMNKVFQLHFSMEQLAGQAFIQVNKWVVDTKYRRQIVLPVKQFTKVPQMEEIEQIIIGFLEEYHRSLSQL